jgi:peptidoglycan/LPS O-acetylase OafA/YrhL
MPVHLATPKLRSSGREQGRSGGEPAAAGGAREVQPAGTRKLGHQPVLDGVRGVAWLTVFIAHGIHIGDLAIGQVAMFVFFGLSGFLITELLYEEYARSGRISLCNFYIRRGLRLVPALVVFLAGWLLVVLIFHGYAFTATVPGGGGGPGVAPTSALEGAGAGIAYLTNWFDIFNVFSGYVPLGHLWSLAVEEQFYIAWALILVTLLALAQRRRSSQESVGSSNEAVPGAGRGAVPRVWRWGFWCAALLAALSFFDVVVIRHASSLTTAIDMSTDTRAGAFLVGAALAAAWSRRARWLAVLGGRLRPFLIGATFVVWLWAAWVFDHQVSAAVFGTAWMMVSVMSALIVVALVERPSSERSWLRSRPATYLGRRSYALYLWHYVWLTWFHGLGMVGVVAAFAATLATAELSWQLVERRALAYKARLAAARKAPSEALSEAPSEVPPPSPAVSAPALSSSVL